MKQHHFQLSIEAHGRPSCLYQGLNSLYIARCYSEHDMGWHAYISCSMGGYRVNEWPCLTSLHSSNLTRNNQYRDHLYVHTHSCVILRCV